MANASISFGLCLTFSVVLLACENGSRKEALQVLQEKQASETTKVVTLKKSAKHPEGVYEIKMGGCDVQSAEEVWGHNSGQKIFLILRCLDRVGWSNDEYRI